MIYMNYTLDDGAFTPEKAHLSDAGLDIRTPISFIIKPGEEYLVDTGVHVEIPIGYCGFLKSKSGLNVKYGITSEGVIDSGYTGSIHVKLRRDKDQKYDLRFDKGDKITQLVILPVPDVKLNRVEALADTPRGNGGFGSTGR